MLPFARPTTSVLGDSLVIEIQEDVYPLPVIFRTCYAFTGKGYLYLRRPRPAVIEVFIAADSDSPKELESLAGSFCNSLIDFQLRAMISEETGKIREMIVAQAFAEGDLLHEEREA